MRVGERWLRLEATIPRPADAHASGDRGYDAFHAATEELQLQSRLPGGIRVRRCARRFSLYADVPLLTETPATREWMCRQAALVGRGFDAARRLCDGARPTPAPECGADPGCVAHRPGHLASRDDERVSGADQLAERCNAAGWSAAVRADASVRVEFVSRNVHRAGFLRIQGDEVRAAVALEAGLAADRNRHSREALAIFLARASHSLRGVRAFVSGSGSSIDEAGFECAFTHPADERLLAQALDAISAAADWYGHEAEALALDAALARRYLESQHRAVDQAAIGATDESKPDVRTVAASAAGAVVSATP